MKRVAEADTQHELEAIADELYALRPDDFAAARDARIRAARADGKPTLARELAKLRRPTLSAWLINMLWRDQHDVMEQLFELSHELSRAQAEAAGSALRELTAQRRQIEQALMQRAAALARQAGATVTDGVAREAQETLTAALAQPEVADEVRGGRLVKPAAYSGFGVLPGAPPASSPRPAPSESRAPIDIQAAQRTRDERQQAQRRVREAREAADAASREVASQSRAADAAYRRHADLSARLDLQREQLRKLESELAAAESEAAAADQARERAEQARATALEALEHAEQSLSAG
jgi:DNA repair exonuclease SbcCD ATPase subunit